MTDDLDRLRLLHLVSRSGSIAAAAREVGHTPSAVSQQLAALERRVGATLLERSTRGVRPTPAGAALAARAGVMLDTFQAAMAEALAVADAQPVAPVRIAAFPTAVTNVLLPALGAGLVSLTIVQLEPDAALAALLDRSVDLAIVDRYDRQPDPLPAGIDHEELLTDALRLCVPPALAGASVADLGTVPWVLGSPSSRLGRVGRLLCHLAGVDPTVVAETDDHHLAFAIAAATGAATFQPGLAIPDLPPAGDLVLSAHDLQVSRRVQLLRRHLPRPDPHLTRVVEGLRQRP